LLQRGRLLGDGLALLRGGDGKVVAGLLEELHRVLQRADRLLQLAEHLAEGRGHLADLVGGVDVPLLGEVAGAQAVRDVGETAESGISTSAEARVLAIALARERPSCSSTEAKYLFCASPITADEPTSVRPTRSEIFHTSGKRADRREEEAAVSVSLVMGFIGL